MKRAELAVAGALAIVLAWNAYLAVTGAEMLQRAVGAACVAFIGFVCGLRFAAYREMISMRRTIEQLPSDITWHVDDDGRRHALVTLNSGDLHDVVLPEHICDVDDALNYVVAQIAV